MKRICICEVNENLACSNCPCTCKYCKGEYFIQVDPISCGCTECLTREYRPAISKEDYELHKNKRFVNNKDFKELEELNKE